MLNNNKSALGLIFPNTYDSTIPENASLSKAVPTEDDEKAERIAQNIIEKISGALE